MKNNLPKNSSMPGIDKTEFIDLFNQYYSLVKNFVYYKTGNIEIADDITQETFIKVWEKRNEIRKETIKPLLYTIAGNLSKNRFEHQQVVFEFANKNNSYAYATYKGDEAIASTFCIYDTKSAYYLMGGYNYKNKHNGAGAMSIWESIKYAKIKGMKFFDFEGSMNQNIERYFRGFGGQLIPYFSVNKAKLPLELLLKFYKRELF